LTGPGAMRFSPRALLNGASTAARVASGPFLDGSAKPDLAGRNLCFGCREVGTRLSQLVHALASNAEDLRYFCYTNQILRHGLILRRLP
jgi:hypothetical protein